MKRHPPEGDVCPASNEKSDCKQIRSLESHVKKNDLDERRVSNRGSTSLTLFKLIKNRKQLGINKGRGFTRENAFVQ